MIYIALLRGINVSGQKIIKMENLRTIFESMQFKHVTTYIQSGNVIFEAEDQETDLLCHKIEARLQSELGYEVTVILKTNQELEEAIRHNPYEMNESDESGKLYVTFLSRQPSPEAIENLLSYQNEIDEFRILDRVVYIFCRTNYGKSQFSNNFLEKKLKVPATTRNWASVNKIAGIAKQVK